MALPANVGHGTVTGRFIDSTGASVEGTVTFTPSPASLANVGATPPVTILPKPATVTLVDGSFTAELVATDDTDNNPAGWTYRVDFRFTGASLASFSIMVPEGAAVDLTTVLPVASANGVAITRGAGVAAGGTTGQVLAKASDGDYDTEWITGGGGGTTWAGITDKPAVVIGDGITTIMAVTQAEYDGLTPDPTTLYVIT